LVKAIVVFDSTWGNTEKIAEAVASGIGGGTKAIRVGAAKAAELQQADLLVFGSPILGGRPSPAMQACMSTLSPGPTGKLEVATFDTRLMGRFVKIFGFAAARMADKMKEMGCNVKATEGFFVKTRTGPLADGELERATQWGKTLSKG
jgi:flavodoxin